jgi:hypothetical protein
MPKKSPTKPEFTEVFAALKAILKKHARNCVVQTDEPDHYYLNTTKECRKRPMMFAAVKIGKQYVSYHLMPVYCCADLLGTMSPQLKKRMQGKACFNFREVDGALFQELDELTTEGYERFKRGGYA